MVGVEDEMEVLGIILMIKVQGIFVALYGYRKGTKRMDGGMRGLKLQYKEKLIHKAICWDQERRLGKKDRNL